MIHDGRRGRGGRFGVTLGLALLLVSVPAHAKESPGLVDGAELLELMGEENLTVEVRLGKTLMSMACGLDPELCDLVGGIDLIHALIFDLSGEDAAVAERQTAKARERLADLERRLLRNGWERIALVKEGPETVRVLLRGDGETVDGFLVMVTDVREVVFVNLSGVIDLAKLQELGRQMEIPGLDRIEDENLERDRDK